MRKGGQRSVMLGRGFWTETIEKERCQITPYRKYGVTVITIAVKEGREIEALTNHQLTKPNTESTHGRLNCEIEN